MDLSVIGCGNWGKNIIRTLSELADTEEFNFREVVHSGNPERAKWVRSNFNLQCHTNLENALKRSSAVCIATPDKTHPRLIKEALRFETHVFVEKPVAFDYETAQELYEMAEDQNCHLVPGHLMVYHPVVKKLNEYNPSLPENFDEIMVTRFNNLRNKGERRLLHSSLIHDISLLDFLFKSLPEQVKVFQARGPYPPCRYLTAQLKFDQTTVHIRARADIPFKERSMIFLDDDISIKFLGLREKLKIDLPEQSTQETVEFNTLPLTEELKNFTRSLTGREVCKIQKEHVIRVMKTLEELKKKTQEKIS